jgi:hypothetical protein
MFATVGFARPAGIGLPGAATVRAGLARLDS